MDNSERVLQRIKTSPVSIGVALGFTKLTSLHNEWIKDMMLRGEDKTLQAHRGSYKTTCVSIALALIMIVYPNDKILFMRKTNADIVEVVAQVRKILESEFMRRLSFLIWGVEVELVQARYDCLVTNLAGNDPRGTPQLQGIGTNASLTGKHFDRIFTDDIVNLEDRISKAERERTKAVYQELQNIKNRGGRIYNTGTPWHEDDCFSIMPAAEVFDCYTTNLIGAEDLEHIKQSMSPSLFAANYELRHIASEDVIFSNPTLNADPAFAEQGECHLDSAFYGEDLTAFTICNKHDGKYYVLGKCWRKNVNDVMDNIVDIRKTFNAGRIHTELNADKGMVAKELRNKGERTATYTEHMNKYVKITTYLKAAWNDVIFVAGTDAEYINQILDYNENAEHDDCPDSLASLLRALWGKKASNDSNTLTSYLR